jgi:hypothetical protein
MRRASGIQHNGFLKNWRIVDANKRRRRQNDALGCFCLLTRRRVIPTVAGRKDIACGGQTYNGWKISLKHRGKTKKNLRYKSPQVWVRRDGRWYHFWII